MTKMTNKVKKVKMSENQLKLTKKEKKCLSNQIDVMLDWSDIMKNNPTFDQVYDYLEEYFALGGHKLNMNDPIIASFVDSVMKMYNVTR